jgi:hypothetical protein
VAGTYYTSNNWNHQSPALKGNDSGASLFPQSKNKAPESQLLAKVQKVLSCAFDEDHCKN